MGGAIRADEGLCLYRPVFTSRVIRNPVTAQENLRILPFAGKTTGTALLSQGLIISCNIRVYPWLNVVFRFIRRRAYG